MNLKNKKIVVYGLGKSGRSALDLLERKGYSPYIYDDNPKKKLLIRKDEQWLDDLSDADVVVVSPSISCVSPQILDLRLNGKLVISEIELASMFCKSEIIAVTGTNGKTTTSLLINEVLKQAAEHSVAVGNIGIPFSEVADRLDTFETAVVEVSSFQLEGISKFLPDVSIFLNLTQDHIDRHKTFENYTNAKIRIFENQTENEIAIVNIDDENLKRFIPSIQAEVIPFSLKTMCDGVYIENDYIKYKGTPVLRVNELQFKGRELQDVMATVAVAMERNIHPFVIACALKKFQKPKHRLEFVGEKLGKKFYNNSKATNIDATLAAIDVLQEPTLLIVGGKDKGEDHELLLKNLPMNIHTIFAVGENAFAIRATAKNLGMKNVHKKDSLEQIFDEINVADEQTILFSPSYKSFDSYKSYEERGEHFKKLFGELDG